MPGGRRGSPTSIFGFIAALLLIGATLLLHFQAGWPWWVAALIALNFTAFALMAYDKFAAPRARPRVPEAVLLFVAAIGGWPAELIAQHLLRHKNRKPRFLAWFWLIVGLWIAAGAGILFVQLR